MQQHMNDTFQAKKHPAWETALAKASKHVVHIADTCMRLYGELLVETFHALRSPKTFRRDALWNAASRIGSRGLGIVGMISFLIGGTIALQSAVQLKRLGAQIYVADLLGISVTRELGPLMAAILIAGRSGSAIAAELASMSIAEELDALRSMGISPLRFVVVPNFLAMTVMQPILTTFANVFALLGGVAVGIWYLDMHAFDFIDRLYHALVLKDLMTGLFKSILFAQIITTVSVTCGIHTQGGPERVGDNTTLSVVASIFAVIAADATCSLLFYFGT